ncbi:MAG: hypothetical protein MZV63_21685 [Marinilabiliales bacterium]|nr:hypothetical protein [Marinilabiliales bacterium]
MIMSTKDFREPIKKQSENRYSDTIDNEDVKPSLERIVWFFDDGSFKEYTPGTLT